MDTPVGYIPSWTVRRWLAREAGSGESDPVTGTDIRGNYREAYERYNLTALSPLRIVSLKIAFLYVQRDERDVEKSKVHKPLGLFTLGFNRMRF